MLAATSALTDHPPQMPRQAHSSSSRTETRHSYASTDRATIKKHTDVSPTDLPPAAPRTIDSLRNQVAEEIALKALRKVEHVDGKLSLLPKSPPFLPAPLSNPSPYPGVKIVVLVTSAGRGDINFLHHVSDSIESRWHLSTEPYLFIVAAAPPVSVRCRPKGKVTAAAGPPDRQGPAPHARTHACRHAPPSCAWR